MSAPAKFVILDQDGDYSAEATTLAKAKAHALQFAVEYEAPQYVYARVGIAEVEVMATFKETV